MHARLGRTSAMASKSGLRFLLPALVPAVSCICSMAIWYGQTSEYWYVQHDQVAECYVAHAPQVLEMEGIACKSVFAMTVPR